MGGKASRDKGKRGEREARDVMAWLTGRPWRRGVGQTRRGSDVPDIEPESGDGSLWVEVKVSKRWPAIGKAMEQAREACGGKVPMVLSKKDYGEWLVTIAAKDLSVLLAELRRKD